MRARVTLGSVELVPRVLAYCQDHANVYHQWNVYNFV